jgi:hypothetical protein
MNAKSQPGLKGGAYPITPERESRVAAALRENLRKRKAQQQQKTEEYEKKDENVG